MEMTEALVQDALLRRLQGRAASQPDKGRYYIRVHGVELELVDRLRTQGSVHLYIEDVEDVLGEVAHLVDDGDMPFSGGVKYALERLRADRYTATLTGE